MEKFNKSPEVSEQEMKAQMIKDYYGMLEAAQQARLDAPQLVQSYENNAARFRELYEDRFGERMPEEE